MYKSLDSFLFRNLIGLNNFFNFLGSGSAIPALDCKHKKRYVALDGGKT